jgi:hypothetical protein
MAGVKRLDSPGMRPASWNHSTAGKVMEVQERLWTIEQCQDCDRLHRREAADASQASLFGRGLVTINYAASSSDLGPTLNSFNHR